MACVLVGPVAARRTRVRGSPRRRQTDGFRYPARRIDQSVFRLITGWIAGAAWFGSGSRTRYGSAAGPLRRRCGMGSITPRTGTASLDSPVAKGSGGCSTESSPPRPVPQRGGAPYVHISLESHALASRHGAPASEGIEALHKLPDNVVAALSPAGLTACRDDKSRQPGRCRRDSRHFDDASGGLLVT